MKVFKGRVFETRTEGLLTGDFCTGKAKAPVALAREWFHRNCWNAQAILAFAAPNEAVQLLYHNEGFKASIGRSSCRHKSGRVAAELPRTDPGGSRIALLEQNWYPWGSFHSHPTLARFSPESISTMRTFGKGFTVRSGSWPARFGNWTVA